MKIFDILRRAAREGYPRIFPARTILFLEDSPASGIWLLHAGKVRLYRSAANGREVLIAFAGPSTILGFSSCWMQAPYQATAQAELDCRISFIPHPLPRAVYNDPHALRQALTLLSAELHDSYLALMTAGGESATTRLGRLLLKPGHEGETHERIAQHLSCSRETVTRSLSILRRDGAVIGMRVVDKARLYRFVG